MSHFAKFSYLEGNQRVTVQLTLTGQTEVTVQAFDGAIINRVRDDIDHRDAHRLITDLFSVCSRLPANQDGDIYIQIGDGSRSRSFAVTPYQLSGRGLEIASIIRTIAKDLLAGYEQRSSRRQGGPRERKAGFVAMAKFFAYFGLSFFLAQVAKTALVVIGALSGPLSLSIAITVGWLLPFAFFHGIGERFGQEYRGNSEVLLVAIPAALLAVWAAYSIGWVSMFAMPGVITLPIAAKIGENAGY